MSTTGGKAAGTAVRGAEFYIGGEFRTAENREPVREAATGELLGDGASATVADIDAAVTSARAALPGWLVTVPRFWRHLPRHCTVAQTAPASW